MATKKPNYLQNVANEVNDVLHAWNATSQMSNTPGPGTDAKANKLGAQTDSQIGQMIGAILQGRRYDSKGKQIKK